ncbi:hypothetical protein BMS3Bbin04_01858 [bacterium BMS3Bbin04]|nr:hypothetical protein BMS3Bbin04_01858 [bacterium BMS3Bbin04]
MSEHATAGGRNAWSLLIRTFAQVGHLRMLEEAVPDELTLGQTSHDDLHLRHQVQRCGQRFQPMQVILHRTADIEKLLRQIWHRTQVGISRW